MKTIDDLAEEIDACEEKITELFNRANTTSFLSDASMLRERLDVQLAELGQLPDKKGPKTLKMSEETSRVKLLAHRLESLTTANMLCRDNAKLLYQEAGQWARHFSTVRMTVATFTITSCTAIIALASRTNGLATGSDVEVPVAILWTLGMSVFWSFTVQTYRERHHQKEWLPLFLMRPLEKDKNLPLDRASVIIAILNLAVLILMCLSGFPKNRAGYIAIAVLAFVTLYGFYFLTDYRSRPTRRSELRHP